ncbi:hypothetical protein KP509_11G032200 [Ceratopteris richardii]|uniref:BHLH domain-containing protein n=1 Tax=Ceratopteris richardii TaxID=49495 RepID=A0A8T2TQB2_CERRI|nr:hypothetical protein KP509_11G032200 [Ceratopteris richardii]
MASLGRDMYMQTNNREDSASPILSAGMEGLFSLMNTIHTHPPSSRLLHEYSSASKSLSHSSNLLQALTNGGNDVASESEGLSLPNSHATTSALTRTSPFDDQATSLHRSIKQEATASVDSESGASVLGRQKRMRSSMECKGPEKEVLDTRKRSKHNENGYNLHAKTEPENTEKIKCTPPRAEKSRDMKTRKQSGSPAEQNSQGVRSNVSKSSSPVSEQGSPPKPEYIHVRARRGQATDSHSLAERVRREKISERMKYLQDLVPSCIKVTGKAMMLDEIINYVQSLQRQVEFLSMKLAAIPPNRLEYSFDALFGRKEVIMDTHYTLYDVHPNTYRNHERL